MDMYTRQFVVPGKLLEDKQKDWLNAQPLVVEMDVLDINHYASVSIVDLAEKAGLKVYDTALPQPWVDDVDKLTGFRIVGHAVWCYDRSSAFGEPVALTREGKTALEIYEHVVKNITGEGV